MGFWNKIFGGDTSPKDTGGRLDGQRDALHPTDREAVEDRTREQMDGTAEVVDTEEIMDRRTPEAMGQAYVDERGRQAAGKGQDYGNLELKTAKPNAMQDEYARVALQQAKEQAEAGKAAREAADQSEDEREVA